MPAEAGGSPSSEASTRSCPPSGFRPDGEHGSSLHPRKPVGRVIRESSDPWGARHVGRLQTLEGRIFPSGARKAARPTAPARGQLDAAALTLTAGVDSRWVKGCGVRAGKRNSERAGCLLRSQDRGFQPTEGVLAPVLVIALTRRGGERGLAERGAQARFTSRGGAGWEERGALPRAPVLRQRTSEVWFVR